MLSLDKEMRIYKRNLKPDSHFSGASSLVGESEFLTPINVTAAEDHGYLNTEGDGSEDLQFKRKMVTTQITSHFMAHFFSVRSEPLSETVLITAHI